MTINTETLRSASKRNDVYKSAMQGLLAWAADRIDAQAAEIARLRGLVTEMAEHGTYETEYDGRMYSICHGCGAQDGEPHRDPNCVYVRAEAALQEKSNVPTV
ncbi:MAG TPA: hypothetical protein VN629_06915 [Castellaniella sp.]|nr:hypothetical protein [Castellaniella sp.]